MRGTHSRMRQSLHTCVAFEPAFPLAVRSLVTVRFITLQGSRREHMLTMVRGSHLRSPAKSTECLVRACFPESALARSILIYFGLPGARLRFQGDWIFTSITTSHSCSSTL